LIWFATPLFIERDRWYRITCQYAGAAAAGSVFYRDVIDSAHRTAVGCDYIYFTRRYDGGAWTDDALRVGVGGFLIGQLVNTSGGSAGRSSYMFGG